MKLFCFAYAGGSAASFLPWQGMFGPRVQVCAVQLPGRGSRLAERPSTSMPPLVHHIADALAQDSALPFAFFGHSLGGLLGFEVARECVRRGQRHPIHLFMSGCAAPQYRSVSRGLHLSSDADLLEALRKYDGTPSEVLDNRDLMELALPAIRADFALVDSYTYAPGVPLPMPISALGGLDDDSVSPAQLAGWASETSNACGVTMYPGGHFFLNTNAQRIVAHINAALPGQDVETLAFA